MSDYRVLKFGGSSVGRPDRLETVIAQIGREHRAGPLAVVVSAMGETTDHLIEAARLATKGEADAAEALIDRIADQAVSNGFSVLGALERGRVVLVSSEPEPRPSLLPVVRELLSPLRQVIAGIALLKECTAQTRDLVMSFGERLCATVVAELLRAAGTEAQMVDARDWLVTDDRFGAALPDWEASQAALVRLAASWGSVVPVHTGFIGRTPDGRTTTLGRNGSDYTATLLARALAAKEVGIMTDISGVMTADPAIVHDARPASRLTYFEALELANFGASMFHARTMIPLIESGIPMRIRSTMSPDDPGTLIDQTGIQDADRPTCVTSLEGQALIDVRFRRLAHEADASERVLRALRTAGLTVWMGSVFAHGQAIAVVVPEVDLEKAKAALHRELEPGVLRGEVDRIGVRNPITLLTVVAERMTETENVAGRFFFALGTLGIRIWAIAQGASSRSISCAIDASDTEVAVRSVHAAFNLAKERVSLFLLGTGVVGGQLLIDLAAQAPAIDRGYGVDLQLVGVASRQRLRFDERSLVAPFDVGAGGPRPADHQSLLPFLDRFRRLPVPVLIDCTAADGMDELYVEAFRRGIHVVAANKKPLCEAYPKYRTLMDAARRHHRAFRYETTVGASLPVIETLKNLVRTGDQVRLIEGSFSGTLGYLTNEVMRGVPLSRAIRVAKERGYTEPSPQDDLSGLDVARKALILARELGLSVSLPDVEVEPLVDVAVLGPASFEDFMKKMEALDAPFSARIEALKADKKTLRYLASVDLRDPSHPRVHVGPTAVPAEHKATLLSGGEAFVAYSTERYDPPLSVSGAGAGAAVTSAGVLADVLQVAQNLRGQTHL